MKDSITPLEIILSILDLTALDIKSTINQCHTSTRPPTIHDESILSSIPIIVPRVKIMVSH
jgi:hypothetical protein